MTPPRSLRELLASPPALDHVLCRQPDQTWESLILGVQGIQETLHYAPGSRILLCVKNPFHFTASLLACWQQGLVPIILPDPLPGTLEQAATYAVAAICDQVPEQFHLPNHTFQAAAQVSTTTVLRQPQDVALELFTSGSTGARKRVPKTFAQLDAEIGVLHQLWGQNAGVRLATVSHQHIYGLIFRILWPLTTQGVFFHSSHLFWETLIPHVAPDKPFTIISSPAHLKHLADAATKTPLKATSLRIFSSGGPLPRTVALAIAKTCGQAPIEVLGSTETGGIAWRQQIPAADQPWTPLPKVVFRINEEGLAVRSPFLEQPDDFLITGDRALAHEDRQFFLRGRLDRIAKIAEKRISLTEMERKLTEHPAVGLAKCVILPHRSDRQRDSLGCVIQLSLAGKKLLFHQGRAKLLQDMRQHLQPHFEAVTLPRHWRFPNRMPIDRQSKIPTSALIELFASKLHERPRFPILLKREEIENGFRFQLEIPENLLQLEGHFKQVAVVAGVVQLHWVYEIIAMETGSPLQVSSLEMIKFHRLLLPKDRFEMEIKKKPSTGRWIYRFTADKIKFASGRIVPAD